MRSPVGQLAGGPFLLCWDVGHGAEGLAAQDQRVTFVRVFSSLQLGWLLLCLQHALPQTGAHSRSSV